MTYLFESKRLGFRNISESDLNSLHQLNSDVEVMKYVDAQRPATRAEVEAWMKRIIAHCDEWNRFGVWAAELKPTGDFIGWFALKPLQGSAEMELGYRLMRKYWGQGFAAEGARRVMELGYGALKIGKIVAVTHPKNTSSQKVLEKLGFLPKGKISYQIQTSGKVAEAAYFVATRSH